MHIFRLLLCLLAVGLYAGSAHAQNGSTAPLERLKAYHFGGDPSVLDSVAQWVRESRPDPDRRRQAARDLAAFLRSDAAFDAKQFACRQLVLIASEEQVSTLAGLLQDDSLAHYALLVLTGISGKAVDEALLRALPRARGARGSRS